ncbi:hypothetical protein AN958_06312 [Leucoagaricus sp. SymC.cos]|nr:hypothetical protein AN958_06312 [Leucoagaricus sp. SymC.cos]
MPLCKRFHSFLSPLATRCRLYSSQPSSPYTLRNLRAFPFTQSPNEAERILSPLASVVRSEKYIESFASRIFPGMGFQSIKPFRLTPVYFPGWILDVEVKGEVTIKGDDRPATAQIHNVYIPGMQYITQATIWLICLSGSDYKVLSSAPLAPIDSYLQNSVPFSEELLCQYDIDVACIPYSISPFSILDIARRLSYSEAKIAQDFRFTPSSLQPTLFAAYPILIPLYLVQYEYESETAKHYHTLILEAYGKDGNIWSEPLSQHHAFERVVYERIRSFITNSEPSSNPIITNLGYSKRFVEIAGFSLTPHQELGHAIRNYLETALSHANTPAALAAASANDLATLSEDKRVREFSREERTPIIEWLKLGSELMMVHRMHDVRAGHVVVTGSGSKGRDKMSFVDGAIQHLTEKSTALEAERRKIKPMWARTEEELLDNDRLEPAEPKTDKGSDSSS